MPRAQLDAFLDECDLGALTDRLAGESLQSLARTLFGPDGMLPASKGRPALLQQLKALGLSLAERQAVATAINKASREGDARVAETEADVNARTAWLRRDTTLALSLSSGDEETPWPRSPRPFLVFTSAGDSGCNVAKWVEPGPREFDLCVCYYGDVAEPACLQVADRSLRCAGGKFPNLVRALQRQLHYFTGFEAILVADDDLLIDAASINALFRFRRAHDLWLLQPANHATEGKADFRELRQESGCEGRLVNFVEVTAPLVRTDKLLAFVAEYLPRRHEGELLVGYGIDRWLCQWLLGVDGASGDARHTDKAAVVDAIPFVNPPNEAKPHGREIERLQPFDFRVDNWQALCRRRGLHETYPFRTFARILR